MNEYKWSTFFIYPLHLTLFFTSLNEFCLGISIYYLSKIDFIALSFVKYIFQCFMLTWIMTYSPWNYRNSISSHDLAQQNRKWTMKPNRYGVQMIQQNTYQRNCNFSSIGTLAFYVKYSSSDRKGFIIINSRIAISSYIVN